MKKKKSIISNAFYNVIFKLANVLFPLVSSAYVARILLSEGVGHTAAAFNNVSYFVVLATLGIPAYGIRETAKRRDDKDSLNTLFTELIVINGGMTLLACVLFMLSIIVIPIFKEDLKLYLIYGISIILNFINLEWLFYGLEEYKFISVRNIIFKITSLLLIVLFVHSPADIYSFAAISVFGTFGNYFCNVYRARKIISIKKNHLDLKQHIKPLIFLSLVSISTELFARIDITMLDIMKNDSIVGFYSYSHRIVNLIIAFLVAVTAVFLPRLSYYYSYDKEKFNKLTKIGTEMTIMISLPAAVGIALISEQMLIVLFGPAFAQAKIILSILAVIIPLKCIGDLVCFQIMFCAGKESVLMISYFIMMIINFINNLFLIPKFGAEGAAVASVVSEILSFAFVFYYSRRYIEFKISIKSIITIICSLLAMGLSIILLNSLSVNSIIKLFIDIVIGIIIYFGINILLKNEMMFDIIKIFRERKKND